jgi:hypothetical protein
LLPWSKSAKETACVTSYFEIAEYHGFFSFYPKISQCNVSNAFKMNNLTDGFDQKNIKSILCKHINLIDIII